MILTQHDVAKNLVISHLDVTDGNTQAKNLLELELDGRANLGDLVLEVLSVRDGGGELASYNDASTLRSEFLCTSYMHTLGETGTKQTGDLLNEGLRGQERVVLLSQLLDELLVLVELLQVVDRLVLEVDLLGAVDVGGIRENANGHARAGDVRESVRDSRVSTAVGREGQTRREGRT